MRTVFKRFPHQLRLRLVKSAAQELFAKFLEVERPTRPFGVTLAVYASASVLVGTVP